MNFADLFASAARRFGTRTALIEGSRSITFAELDGLSRRVAAHLAARGVAEGSRIGVALPDGIGHVACLIGAARAGAAVLPINWRAKRREVVDLAASARLALVIGDRRTGDLGAVPVQSADEAWWASIDMHTPTETAATDDAVLFVAMSSGTTATARTSTVTHSQYQHRYGAWQTLMGDAEGLRYLSTTPLCFSGGRNHVIRALFGGATTVLHPFLVTPEDVLEQAEAHRIDWLFFVPDIARQVMRLAPTTGLLLPGVKRLIIGADTVSPEEKIYLFRNVCHNFFELYGTSLTDTISCLKPDHMPHRAASVGRLLDAFEAEIVDEDGDPVPAGVRGQLRLRAPALFDDEDGRDIRDGWYYPADIASISEDGFLSLHGRASNVFKRRGFTVYAEDVEAVLRRHPAVNEAALLSAGDGGGAASLVAYVEAETTISEAEMLAFCRGELSAYKIPDRFEIVARLPRSESGKVRREALVPARDGPISRDSE